MADLPQLKMTPLDHQRRIADTLKQVPGLIAYHGVGSGKTMSAINAAHENHLPLLAIVPAGLRNNMRKEITASGFQNPHMIVSYTEALNKLNDPAFRDFAQGSLLAIDEAHRAGRADSARSRLPIDLPAQKKLFLTGTPFRNSPAEIAPLVNALKPGALPADPAEFERKFLPMRKVPVGFWGMLRGIKPGSEQRPENLQEFRDAIEGVVDIHHSVDRSNFPSFDESLIQVPMSGKQHATYKFVMNKYPRLAYKIRHGIPLNKTESRNFQAFMTGPRQVANHPGPYNRSATDADAPKITRMADEIQTRFEKDPNYRGVSYSAYIDAGVAPLQRELERRKIPYGTFTGGMSDAERKKVIEDYNTGQVKHLLISGAGAEGLDLKGTKLMQITEPHWNEELINQVRARAIRYRSHSHLPEEERHVEVQRFHSVPPPTILGRLVGKERSSAQTADEYIFNLAKRKQELNRPFVEALKAEGQKTASVVDEPSVDSSAEWVMIIPHAAG
jgi:hypothetical protein